MDRLVYTRQRCQIMYFTATLNNIPDLGDIISHTDLENLPSIVEIISLYILPYPMDFLGKRKCAP